MTIDQPNNNSCESWSPWLSFLADLSVDTQTSCPAQFVSSDLDRWAKELKPGLDSAIELPAGNLEDCLSHLQSCSGCQKEINAYQIQNESLGSSIVESDVDYSFDPTFDRDQTSSERTQQLISDCFKQFEFQKGFPNAQSASEKDSISKPRQTITQNYTPASTAHQIGESVYQKEHSSKWLRWFSAVAIAASVLLIVTIANWPNHYTTQADSTAETGRIDQKPSIQEEEFHNQLLTKVSDLHQMNKSNWVDQQLMVVSLKMELRTLREKMVSLDADPESKNKIITNIDRLLDSVRSVRTPALTSSVAQANPAVHITPPKNQ